MNKLTSCKSIGSINPLFPKNNNHQPIEKPDNSLKNMLGWFNSSYFFACLFVIPLYLIFSEHICIARANNTLSYQVTYWKTEILIAYLPISWTGASAEALGLGRLLRWLVVTLSRCSRIFFTTAGSSIQASTLTVPPQCSQTSTSMLKTRFNRCAQRIDARSFSGGWSWASLLATFFLPLPRLLGVICARYLLLGANTPWDRVKFTLGLGTNAASFDMKSSGSNTTWVVPSLLVTLVVKRA